MGSLYDRANIYDLFEDENRYQAYKQHWEYVLKGKNIQTMLDVSIGSGSVTLPVLELGIILNGSDLNENMLANCKKKISGRNNVVELKHSDFRDLSCWNGEKFDLVACTGNSLAHVCNFDVMKTLEEMDSHVSKGGYLYFDTRNWDKILAEHNRFYLYNPLYDGDNRVNLIQVWDYNTDGTMTFNILYTFENNNKIFQKEKFEEHYYPISKVLLMNKLNELGYKDIEVKCFPAQFPIVEFERIDWYTVIAQKVK